MTDGPSAGTLSRPYVTANHWTWLCASRVPDFRFRQSRGGTQAHPDHDDKGRSLQQSQDPFLRGIEFRADAAHSRRLRIFLRRLRLGKFGRLRFAREVDDSVLYHSLRTLLPCVVDMIDSPSSALAHRQLRQLFTAAALSNRSGYT
jgi:hypothetical protein